MYRIGPAVLRQSTYGTIKFGIYYTLKNRVGSPDKEDLSTNVFCGVVAGTVSSAIANPTDVLKVRMQACSTTLQQKSILECFQDVYQQEGLAGLWRVIPISFFYQTFIFTYIIYLLLQGVGPTAQRAAVLTAVELPIYDAFKHHLFQPMGDSVYNHLMWGLD